MTQQPGAQPKLSIVIPAYNEEARLPTSLKTITDFVIQRDYPVEVIVVDNNSRDRTRAIADEYAAQHPYVRVLFEGRQGKGAAVRTGILAAKGEFRFICDADLSMPIEEVEKFMPPAIPDCDIAIGSREAPGAVRYEEPAYRHLMGRVFNTFVRVLIIPGLQDTQCGFKMFCGEVAEELFPLQTTDGWSFDVELLHAALRRGHTIVEVPIHWTYGTNTRIDPIRSSLEMVRDVLAIWWKGKRGLYDKK